MKEIYQLLQHVHLVHNCLGTLLDCADGYYSLTQ